MQPVVVRNEIDGFLADRLMEAMWREALWLVHDGVATTQELDDVIRYGPGLRWAFLGTFLTYRIAGGEQGMRHFIAQFGPALKAPWTKLTDVPELTESFIERIVEQSDLQAAGRSIAELELERDDCLVALLQALRANGAGAGETVATWERALLGTPDEAAGADGWQAPLSTLRREVPTAWIDYNGHVTESRYLEMFADANDVLLRLIGVDAAYLESGRSYFTAETHISHLGQLMAGDRVTVTTQVLGADDKRLHLFHVLTRDGDAAPAATAEQMMLHVDTTAGRTAPATDGVAGRVAELADAHASLPVPERAGRRIALN
jgi:carnitine 3-dehydrogenase